MTSKEIYRVWYCKEIQSNNGEWHMTSGTIDIMAKDEEEAYRIVSDKGYTVTGVKETWS